MLKFFKKYGIFFVILLVWLGGMCIILDIHLPRHDFPEELKPYLRDTGDTIEVKAYYNPHSNTYEFRFVD